MKRGLKAIDATVKCNECDCSNLCPDEKGTERLVVSSTIKPSGSSNLCPDEKGTESPESRSFRPFKPSVATYAPMKRGLKAFNAAPIAGLAISSNLCPDERGLKGPSIIHDQCLLMSSNLCPDEKGTESRMGTGADLHPSPSSNLCPDEKGTESREEWYHRMFVKCVATYAPMKRGLKDPYVHSNNLGPVVSDQVATYAPMKRGLKGELRRCDGRRAGVATYAPMKRGLKAQSTDTNKQLCLSSNLCPDEKGTESQHGLDVRCRFAHNTSSNLCPDEKGTESGGESFSIWLKVRVFESSNLCPDEKGTERCRDLAKKAYPTVSV